MKKLIVANWKCNPTSQKEAKKLLASFRNRLKKAKNVEVVICPPFVYLPDFQPPIPNFKLGSQDCFWREKGAFTGEISPKMLKDLGCRYVIVGHSERRKIFGETDEMIGEKVREVLKEKLLPIFCLGETKQERREGRTFKVLERQFRQGLKKAPKKEIEKIVFAYEPVWAIGTGNSCSVEEASKAILFLRKIISRAFNKKAGKEVKILYGGSVDSQNAPGYLGEPWINGLLVGGASLEIKEFAKIIKSVNIRDYDRLSKT